MEIALLAAAGAALLLAAVALLATVLRGRSGLSDAQVADLVRRVQGEVSAAQDAALQRNSAHFLELATTRLQTETARHEEQLKARNVEIDRSVDAVGEQLRRLRDYVETTDKQRALSIEHLVTVTEESRRTVAALGATTTRLNETLASGQARGQWGERMADDILRIAGFIEGVQYRKNRALEQGGGRPDFTFLLPGSRVLHMDVKFPLQAYLRYLEAPSDGERSTAVRQFLQDARQRVREVATRDYIDPSSGTLDYALLFIPNEQVYAFIHEHDPALLDGALRDRIVLCSPFTLFAVLAVVRQATENFHLSQQTDEILQLLGGFHRQWDRYKQQSDIVARRLERTSRAFDDLTGVRTRMLDQQLARVEQLRVEAGLSALEVADGEEPLLTSEDYAATGAVDGRATPAEGNPGA